MPESALSETVTAIPCLVESVLKARESSAPAVTVCWAQSLDGAIAPADGKRTTLSSPESLALTHRLRSMHRAILVGIGTVLADDPQLTVRLVGGPSPQPVVLDSSLRLPLSARLLARTDAVPWIFHASGAPAEKVRELERRGARLFALHGSENGLPLEEVLRILGAHRIRSLMVEGGARMLRSFMTEGQAHQAVVTVSPMRMDGIRIFDASPDQLSALDFVETSQEKYGRDTVTWGRFD